VYVHELLEQRQKTEVNKVAPDCPILDLASQMSSHGFGASAVVDAEGKLVGIVTERDLVRLMSRSPEKMSSFTVSDIMSRNVVTSDPDDEVSDAMNRMSEIGVRHLPVLENGELIAIISIRDFQVICDHLGKLAKTDSLTGLANRREFMKLLEAEFSRFNRFDSPFSVAMLDIDFFKNINDEHGHNAGDTILVRFADIFRTQLRAYDVAGRLGGEEFAILFPNTSLEGAVTACEHLREAIKKIALFADTGLISCTASFGVTMVVPEFAKPECILKFSDELLYQAKEQGRDRIIGASYQEHAAQVLNVANG
jgi:diguanylate cyclase (GGDEF)-like protein